jgi:hypothetical protein
MSTMNTHRLHRVLPALVVLFGLLAFGPVVVAQGHGKGGHGEGQGQGQGQGHGQGHGKANHHNGKQMLGDKIKTNGRHVIDKKGDYTAAADVQNGKVAGVHVTHATKGEVPVTKYKTNKPMAQVRGQIVYASFRLIQDEYLGTTYIGFGYVDDFGNEEIYWFPYDMVLNGDTGAIDYYPAA